MVSVVFHIWRELTVNIASSGGRFLAKIVFITGHSFAEKARVSVHFMASAAVEAGHGVSLFVAGIGPATRFKSLDLWNLPKQVWTDREGVAEYAGRALTVPVDLRRPWLNAASSPIFGLYGRALPHEVAACASAADLIVVESGIGAAFLQALGARNLLRRTIFLAADDMDTIRGHPVLKARLEAHWDELADVVSFGAYAGRSTRSGPVKVVPKGIDKRAFAAVDQPNPYATPGNIVCVGNMLADPEILSWAERTPELTYHLIGAFPGGYPSNVRTYGLMPFAQTVGYIQHADAGLLPYRAAPNMGYLMTSSLKLAQFRCVGHAVIGPREVDDGKANFVPFERESGAFAHAARTAVATARRPDLKDAVADYRDNWRDIEVGILETWPDHRRLLRAAGPVAGKGEF